MEQNISHVTHVSAKVHGVLFSFLLPCAFYFILDLANIVINCCVRQLLKCTRFRTVHTLAGQ